MKAQEYSLPRRVIGAVTSGIAAGLIVWLIGGKWSAGLGTATGGAIGMFLYYSPSRRQGR